MLLWAIPVVLLVVLFLVLTACYVCQARRAKVARSYLTRGELKSDANSDASAGCGSSPALMVLLPSDKPLLRQRSQEMLHHARERMKGIATTRGSGKTPAVPTYTIAGDVSSAVGSARMSPLGLSSRSSRMPPQQSTLSPGPSSVRSPSNLGDAATIQGSRGQMMVNRL